MVAIELRNVFKKFKNHTAVNNISFSIPENIIFGLLGSNGAGKSTTINMMTGLLIPDGGNITVLGMDVRKEIEKIRKNIALVPQTISLYENLTVYENLEFFGGMYIKNSKQLKIKIQEMIETFELKGHENVLISRLSGGYQRRCSIACALISDPKILFLDEPLTGIDINTHSLILKLLKGLKGTTIIFTTHSIMEAELVCDYLVFMDRGEKLIEGTPKQIVETYSKHLGEKIIIEFKDAVSPHHAMHSLNKNGFRLEGYELYGKTLSFFSRNIGKGVIDIMSCLKDIDPYILNVDIIKPNLEHIFTYIMHHRK